MDVTARSATGSSLPSANSATRSGTPRSASQPAPARPGGPRRAAGTRAGGTPADRRRCPAPARSAAPASPARPPRARSPPAPAAPRSPAPRRRARRSPSALPLQPGRGVEAVDRVGRHVVDRQAPRVVADVRLAAGGVDVQARPAARRRSRSGPSRRPGCRCRPRARRCRRAASVSVRSTVSPAGRSASRMPCTAPISEVSGGRRGPSSRTAAPATAPPATTTATAAAITRRGVDGLRISPWLYRAALRAA